MERVQHPPGAAVRAVAACSVKFHHEDTKITKDIEEKLGRSTPAGAGTRTQINADSSAVALRSALVFKNEICCLTAHWRSPIGQSTTYCLESEWCAVEQKIAEFDDELGMSFISRNDQRLSAFICG
jgi:hypothetical protein